MKAEILALEDNKTWTIADLSYDKFLIGCKWIFKVKYKSVSEVSAILDWWLRVTVNKKG